MIKLSALGSGSKGNALVLSCEDGAIIIDVGFSRKETRNRMESLQLHPERLSAALLTHEHDDHSRGCRVFCNDLKIPLYTTSLTADFLRRKEKQPDNVIEFEAGGTFETGGFEISAFSVQHDARDPVGFVIERGHVKIGVATDLGDVNALARNKLHDCNALVLESNYDEKMLMASDRQIYLKRRILGRHGHLDNLAALAALDDLLTERTKYLLLAHLSSECNDRDLVQNLFTRKLHEMKRDDIRFFAIRQDAPLGPLELPEDVIQ